MSFLNNTNSEFLSARITQKGRNAIASGNFNISFFQIGDSEFDYTSPFSAFTGNLNVPYQRVMSPMDKESGVKYPYKIDSTSGSTTYGIPVNNASVTTIRNVMGPAGFISNYIDYDDVNQTGSTIFCVTDSVPYSALTGSSQMNVVSGSSYQVDGFVVVIFDQLGGLDPNYPVVTGNCNSMIYRVTGITSNTLYFDRPIPALSSIGSGYAYVISLKCENEYPVSNETSPVCHPIEIDPSQQLNAWTLNVVWGDKIIGDSGFNENLTGYTSNTFVSAKSLLGYTTSNQTYVDITGGTISKPTSFTNSYNEEIEVLPEEQRCVAIVHYSELGDATNDPNRFFKYDDYISYDDSVIDTVATDNDGNDISDTEYFEVYIPFILYHRNTGTTAGARFFMDGDTYSMKSTISDKHQMTFRYLVDEQGYKVGKVFPNNKIVVFDDQDLVAVLDYRSNRRYTLPAPKAMSVPTDHIVANSLLTGGTGQTVWVTYMLAYTGETKTTSLPCNYFNKVSLTDNTPSQVGIVFDSGSFSNMVTSYNDFPHGFIANKFYVLAQLTNTGDLPQSDSWKIMDFTSDVGGDGSTPIQPSGITNNTLIITKDEYENYSSIFDLESYMSGVTTNYLGSTSFTTEPQFGDEQPFPGSVRMVRATDIQEMNFLVNLPASQFTESQNPTYTSGEDKKITEVALLNDNKEVVVIAKTAVPVTRTGTQVFGVKLDF